ncbi:MAG: hypothetical protein AB1371_09690 [Pseudomonadota bacterium]
MKTRNTFIAVALMASLASGGAAFAAEPNSGGNPPATSAPTHTVPATPQHLVIKNKSSPPRSEDPKKPTIEEKKLPVPPNNCGPTKPGDPKTSTC